MLAVAGKIQEVLKAIRSKYSSTPRVGIVLGTGLGNFADEIAKPLVFPYAKLPHFPHSTAIGHAGQLILGELQGVPVVAMQGRFHLYEGYTPQQVAFPIRIFQALGASTLIVTNAAGGVNPHYACGDIVVLHDHIDLMTGSSLMGVNDDSLGPRFPDMSEPYDLGLIEKSISIAIECGFTLHRGVYVGMNGPTYETRAEYRFLRAIGGDVIGMSTVPEVITAVHAGMKVLGLSTVTNVCLPDALGETSGEAVAEAAEKAEARLRKIVLGVVQSL